jgi:hypothetical protein
VTVITTAFLIRTSLWEDGPAGCCAGERNDISPTVATENTLTALRLMATPRFLEDSLGILRGGVQHRQLGSWIKIRVGSPCGLRKNDRTLVIPKPVLSARNLLAVGGETADSSREGRASA